MGADGGFWEEWRLHYILDVGQGASQPLCPCLGTQVTLAHMGLLWGSGRF